MYSQAKGVYKPSTRQSEFSTEFGMKKGSNSQFIFNSCTYNNITDCTELSRILDLGLDLEKLDSLQSYRLEYTVEQMRAARALSFGLLPWQYGSGSFAEKSLLALLSHTRKSSNLRVHIRDCSTNY